MRSETPKHVHPLLGRRLVDWVADAARALDPDPLVLVTSPEHAATFDGLEVAVQHEPLGTGHAVLASRSSLDGHNGDVLVIAGDSPLLRPETLRDLLETHQSSRAAATVLTFTREDPGSYGRIVRGAGGAIQAIVEATDLAENHAAITELNSSTYVFDAQKLWPALERLDPANAQGELYLTDAVRVLVEEGARVSAHQAAPGEAEGVNTRVELAAAAAALRDRINEEHMLAGVTIVDPASTWIDPTVELEPDVTIHPFTVLRGQTRVASGAEVGPHAVAVDAVIGPSVLVGPFCYLRPGTVLEAGAKAGTFVEIKNSRIGARTKVPHLSYIGDAEIGEGTNIAAGNITVNYPHQAGRPKGRTKIGDNVRTGVQNAFVAPVEVGERAWVAAGTVVTKDVPPGALAVGRARQENKEGYADRGDGGTDDDDND
jgi:bifunctional UDP-N-acetylglucosamine pyrophosphorylase/glucosamine-1-phosphate N-acetyltransferase